MGVSKVIFGNDTVMDITDSTVTSNNLLDGEVAYGANGNRVVGSVTVPTVLDDLSDVTITNPTDGQGIVYNNGDWINGDIAKVKQTATSTNANYEVLFSETADNTTRIEGARKYNNLKFNPSTGNLQATQLNGVTIGNSPKFTDTTYTGTGLISVNDSTHVISTTATANTGTVTSVTIKGTSPITSSSETAITGSGTVTLSHANSGVTANTYRSVTVNATGHVTAGTNPTTLSGYGITDAKIDTSTNKITLGSNTITPLTSIPAATSNALGGIKIGYSENGTNYAVKLSSEKAYVNVPWTNTTYTFAEGTTDGAFTVTPSTSGATTQTVNIHGLGSAAYTASGDYIASSDNGLKTIKVDRGVSHTTAQSGYWAAMLRSSNTGSPVLPTAGKWWHVLSMDWTGDDVTKWISQLAIPTKDDNGVWYRKNDAEGTGIDASTWHRLAEGDSNGYANRALADGDGNTISSTYFKTANIKNTYSGTDGNAISGKGVKAAIDGLNGGTIGTGGTGKTITALSQSAGNVSATFQNISILSSQVSDLESTGVAYTARGVRDATVRVTTADTYYSDARMRYYLSSSTIDSKPLSRDGGIIHMPWDNTGGYDAQLFVSHNGSTNTRMAIRSQSNKTWGDWIPVGVFSQTTPTSGRVVTTNGTDGGIQASDYTIQTSVPSNAIFTDEKVKQTEITTGAGTWKDIAIANSTSTSEEKTGLYKTYGLSMQMNSLATTSAEGKVVLAVGNSQTVASGNRYKGYLDIYNAGVRNRIYTSTTANVNTVLPNRTGTVAYVDDIYKNFFNGLKAVPRTNKNVAATLYDDTGLIKLNGTCNGAGANLNQFYWMRIPEVKEGDKIIISYEVISGTFTHTDSSNTTIYIVDNAGSGITGARMNFPASMSTSTNNKQAKTYTVASTDIVDGICTFKGIQIYMRTSDVFNNLVLAIMVRKATDANDVYQPFIMSNQRLTESILWKGEKNVLKPNDPVQSPDDYILCPQNANEIKIVCNMLVSSTTGYITLPLVVSVGDITATASSGATTQRFRTGYYQSGTNGGELSIFLWKNGSNIEGQAEYVLLNGVTPTSYTLKSTYR